MNTVLHGILLVEIVITFTKKYYFSDTQKSIIAVHNIFADL